jgi:hypothetical protein
MIVNRTRAQSPARRAVPAVTFVAFVTLLVGWLATFGWRPTSTSSFLLQVGPVLASVAVAVVGLAVRARRPATFAPACTATHPGGWLAARLPWWYDRWTLAIVFFTGGIRHELGLRDDQRVVGGWLVAASRGLYFGVTPVAVVVLISLTTLAIYRKSGLELRPDGLLLRGLTRDTTMPWTAVRLAKSSNDGLLTLMVGDPGQVHKRPARKVVIDLSRLVVDPLFLGSVVRHYLANPSHRPMIGADSEQVRLRSLLRPEPGGSGA